MLKVLDYDCWQNQNFVANCKLAFKVYKEKLKL